MASHYSADFLSGGVYKHHEGSSKSSPKGSNSWIKALKKAHDEVSFTCSCVSCNEVGTDGAHLRKSLWSEISPVIGLGGTPVVPMCAHDHGAGPVEIGETPCIYDKNTKIDWWSSQPSSNARTSSCSCGASTLEDPEGDYYCDACEHYTSQDGQCITDSCSTCNDDYDDDDYDDDDGDNDNSNLEARYRSMQSIGQDIADRYRNR